MRAFALKHKGKSIWQNMMFDRELIFSDGDKVFAGLLFFRKKDAKKYLETFKYKEYYDDIDNRSHYIERIIFDECFPQPKIDIKDM